MILGQGCRCRLSQRRLRRGCLALAACGPASQRADPPLAGTQLGGDFTLIDKAGKPLRSADLAGKWRVLVRGLRASMRRSTRRLKAIAALLAPTIATTIHSNFSPSPSTA